MKLMNNKLAQLNNKLAQRAAVSPSLASADIIDRDVDTAAEAVIFALLLAVKISEKETRERALMLLRSPSLRDNLLRQAKLWVEGR
jgi:hypothetical protein